MESREKKLKEIKSYIRKISDRVDEMRKEILDTNEDYKIIDDTVYSREKSTVVGIIYPSHLAEYFTIFRSKYYNVEQIPEKLLRFLFDNFGDSVIIIDEKNLHYLTHDKNGPFITYNWRS